MHVWLAGFMLIGARHWRDRSRAKLRENWFSMPSESVRLTTGYWQLLLARLLHDGQVHVALQNHLSRNLEVLDTFLAGQVVHQVKHQLF